MNRLTSPTGDILPASEGTLIYFASYLARTVRHCTIKTYLAAVRNLHIVSVKDLGRLHYRKKSIYHRKYHYEKKVNEISKRYLNDEEKM